MSIVPGTYFTKAQLETALEVDNVSAGDCTGRDRMKQIGLVYHSKEQYDKALAWHLLAARENNSYAQNNIGTLYYSGYSVPNNYLCALKWQLKAAKQNEYEDTPNNVGMFFEYGYGVPLDKHKALEWYCHGGNKSHRDRLKSEGYHRSAANEIKTLEQLRKETEAILDAEKKKLEQKQNKTQQEMKALVDLNIAYKLTGGGQYAWQDVPMLLDGPFEEGFNEMTKQIRILSQENSTFKYQDIELQSLKQDKKNTSNEIERLKASNITLEQLLKSKEDVIMSLKRENQILSTANQGNQQGTKEMVDILKSLLRAKENEIELNNLKMENALDKEKGKTKKLLKEIKRLKQHQQTVNSRDTRPSSNTTVPEPTGTNTGTNEDDPNNDINYDKECDTGNSSSDDTSSESGDRANDLNYESDV